MVIRRRPCTRSSTSLPPRRCRRRRAHLFGLVSPFLPPTTAFAPSGCRWACPLYPLARNARRGRVLGVPAWNEGGSGSCDVGARQRRRARGGDVAGRNTMRKVKEKTEKIITLPYFFVEGSKRFHTINELLCKQAGSVRMFILTYPTQENTRVLRVHRSRRFLRLPPGSMS